MYYNILTAELKETAVKTYTGEYAWKYKETKKIIEYLKSCEYIILGGDVLNDMLNYTYDNWYYEVEHESSVIEAIAASASKAVQYLDMYHTKNGDSYYYILVAEKKRYALNL
ncbi:MAG: hypothetical protein IJE70_03675 [Oscillospiraceae bacterium]|nr:hypothetical protein [Oscillospiraceae bacterium]